MFCRFSSIKTQNFKFFSFFCNFSKFRKIFSKIWILVFGFGFYALRRVKKYITFTPKILIFYSFQNFQKFKILIFLGCKSTWHTLLTLIPAFFRCTTRKIAIAGASMPPIGRDLENPSLTSGGQTVTLVKKFTETLLHNFWWAFECCLSQLSSSIGYEDNRGKCLFLANFEFLKCDFADSKFEPKIYKNYFYDSHTQRQKNLLRHFSAKIFHLYDLAVLYMHDARNRRLYSLFILCLQAGTMYAFS